MRLGITRLLLTVCVVLIAMMGGFGTEVVPAGVNTSDNGKCSIHVPNWNLNGCPLAGADLAYLDLTGSLMIDTDLRGANMSAVYMVNANMCRANLSGAYLGIAVLDYAVLCHANLRGAYLGGASLWNANLKEADLSGADLSDANLRYAVMGRTNLDQVIWNNTTCPDGSNSDAPDGDGFTCFYNLE